VLAVEDLMHAFEAVRNRLGLTAGEVYNVGGGLNNTVSLLELIAEIRCFTGHRLEYETEPVRPGDQPLYVTDFDKLRQHTGWQPQMSLEQILEEMYEWWKENRELFRPADVPAARFALSDLRHAPGVVS
jgi:CDP-paratose 2-epimerase